MAGSLFRLPRSRARRVALPALAVVFVATGVNHFVQPGMYVAIMPPYLPAPLALVYLSGFFEVLGGIGVLPRATRSFAGWGLAVLLLAIFPANVHMALHPELFADLGVTPTMLYARLPLQFVLIVWAVWATRPDAPA